MIKILEKLKKYNYWDDTSMEMEGGFLREVYLQRIDKYLDNNLIKVVIGQRRTGKSYLLRQIIKKLIEKGVNRKNIFYLNKEIVDFDEIQDYMDLKKLIDVYKKQLKVKGKIYYFLDEIQEIEQWEKIVNSLSQDYKNKAEVFISGSNSHLLSGELSTFLSGRYVEFEILPFSFVEYCQFLQKARDKKSFLEYLSSGGLPELFNLSSEESKRHYVESLKDTIILKDIVSRRGIKDVVLLDKIFDFLSDNIGNLFSVNSIVKYLNSHNQKTNFETVSNYVKYLEDVFLIHKVERYDVKGKLILGGEKKYYLNDLSFHNYLFSSFDYGLGKNLENIVYLYYRSQDWNVYVGKIGKNEIDFVMEKQNKKKYIQVTHSLITKKIINREFGNLEKINDSYEKLVISMDDKSLGNKEGIEHKLAWEIMV